ncbi:hypothetical protein ILUMI_24384 [Ignelater luminosus]|uniref:PiggyBac transposable element-derived protein domain-containing protein n=1 Tax=Ignelater luminosus TaxID=2038154 RepID=A0A8K0G115_IGNLU|nr:hypothetical protein ILUMI_24384 [Ignelater luminosus]
MNQEAPVFPECPEFGVVGPVGESVDEPPNEDHIFQETNQQNTCRKEKDLTYDLFNIKNIQWIKGDLEELKSELSSEDYSAYRDKSAAELFELFFNDSVFLLLEKETRRHALAKNCPDLKFTVEELKCFTAIWMISGNNELPEKRYWASEGGMRNAMRRDRFF